MTDVTAQAFREAASQFRSPRFFWALAPAELTAVQKAHTLLLAAAEQREQLEQFVDLHARQMRVKDGVIEANGIIREGLEKQIATLTAERDEARAKLYEHTVTSVTAGANPQKDGGMSAPLFHVNCLLCGERWSLQTWKRDEADKLHPIGKCINAVMRTK